MIPEGQETEEFWSLIGGKGPHPFVDPSEVSLSLSLCVCVCVCVCVGVGGWVGGWVCCVYMFVCVHVHACQVTC